MCPSPSCCLRFKSRVAFQKYVAFVSESAAAMLVSHSQASDGDDVDRLTLPNRNRVFPVAAYHTLHRRWGNEWRACKIFPLHPAGTYWRMSRTVTHWPHRCRCCCRQRCVAFGVSDDGAAVSARRSHWLTCLYLRGRWERRLSLMANSGSNTTRGVLLIKLNWWMLNAECATEYVIRIRVCWYGSLSRSSSAMVLEFCYLSDRKRNGSMTKQTQLEISELYVMKCVDIT